MVRGAVFPAGFCAGCGGASWRPKSIDPGDIAERVTKAIQAHHYAWTSEDDLQRGVALALEAAGVRFEREAVLDQHSRPDFLVPGMPATELCQLAVEVKIKGSTAALIRQLWRYAEHPRVVGVLLVTPSYRLTCPDELARKPAWVCRVH